MLRKLPFQVTCLFATCSQLTATRQHSCCRVSWSNNERPISRQEFAITGHEFQASASCLQQPYCRRELIDEPGTAQQQLDQWLIFPVNFDESVCPAHYSRFTGEVHVIERRHHVPLVQR